MKPTLILIELILLIIVAASAFVAHEFYKSKDGRLRILVIRLFLCKVWIYGGAAVLFMVYPPDKVALIRLIVLNVPMLLVMLQLYQYIRNHNS